MQDSQSLKPYRTVRQNSQIELVIQKSRFIGRCFPVKSEGEVAATLEQLRKQHWDATHNCYALRVGNGVITARSSDDGEPSGTAGAPILNVLTRLDLTDTLCVVTRYFGGILLGAGGLVRTYSKAATKAAEEAGMVQMTPATGYQATLSYAQWAALESAMEKICDISQVSYTDAVTVEFYLFDREAEAALVKINNLSEGRVRPVQVARCMRPES